MILNLRKIRLKLKVNWKISRSETLYKENFILSDGRYESEVAPNLRYNESPELIEENFLELQNQASLMIQTHWCHSFQNAVNNLNLKRNHTDIYKFLNLEPVSEVITSFSIPIMDKGDIESYINTNSSYLIYKLKISNKDDIDILKEVSRCTNKKIRIDANEGFGSIDEYLEFENLIQKYNIEFVEQPFRAAMKDEYRRLKPISKFEIIADESIERDFDAVEFSELFHGVNIKLMKAGGIENAKYLLEKAKNNHLKTMLGCMIETSLGISDALYLASLADYVDLDGSLLLENDPYTKPDFLR